MQPRPQSKTVFVLSGGGNLGAVQVGMLRALFEAGIRPDAVVGTSIGALNGAFLVGHADLRGVEALAGLWTSIRRSEVFPLSVRNLARGALGRQEFVIGSLGLRNVIARAQLGFERLEDAPIPIRVVATDVVSGQAIVLERGDTTTALLASSAIPGVYPSVEIDGLTLVDGGIVANTPIVQAEGLEPTRVYVLPAVPDRVPGSRTKAILMVQRAMALALQPADRRALAEAATRCPVWVLPVPGAAGQVSAFDFSATERLMDDAYDTTASWLEARAFIEAAA